MNHIHKCYHYVIAKYPWQRQKEISFSVLRTNVATHVIQRRQLHITVHLVMESSIHYLLLDAISISRLKRQLGDLFHLE